MKVDRVTGQHQDEDAAAEASDESGSTRLILIVFDDLEIVAHS